MSDTFNLMSKIFCLTRMLFKNIEVADSIATEEGTCHGSVELPHIT